MNSGIRMYGHRFALLHFSLTTLLVFGIAGW